MVEKIIFSSLTGISLLIFGGFSLRSFLEREKRAAVISLCFTILFCSFFIASIFLPKKLQFWVLLSLFVIILFSAFLFFLPIGKVNPSNPKTNKRIDERDVIFSRNELQPGSEDFNDFYSTRKEVMLKDQNWRSNPGLLSPKAAFTHPLAFAASAACFRFNDTVSQLAKSNVATGKMELNPQEASRFLKKLARYYGALDVGICQLNPKFIYTHSGRGHSTYGEEIHLNHKFAIAMTFEMNLEMIHSNPKPSGIMETSKQYARSAFAATIIAETIRNLGYPATAHFEGHYQVIAPPIAQDAGLGEIGRMSLLMTPRYGPRVRLAIVTTDLPLSLDNKKSDSSIIDFCIICKKCANNCHADAISLDKRKEINGALRWVINPEACFEYWTKVGTDCGKCMAVCPYSHSNKFPHNLIRWGIQQSGAFRRAALFMDDVFYGKKPVSKPLPTWLNFHQK